MVAWAYYRLPHADHYVRIEQTSGEPEAFESCTALNGRQGFVVAPFDIRPEHPVLLIRPDKVERGQIRRGYGGTNLRGYEGTGVRGCENNSRVESTANVISCPRKFVPPYPQRICPHSARKDYAIDFASFHAQLLKGNFRKIVLARCADEATAEPIPPEELFFRACERYPRMFISLVYTSLSGYWLTATPEILLENDGPQWRTIALAGTMKLEGEQLAGEGETITWSTKNIQEQRYVATYLTACLCQFTSDLREEGPRTVRAANLVHLRSDFTFTLPDTDHLGDLLHTLHPTPAVCGLPKHDALRFIVANEHVPRRYYSGFMGPLALSPQPSHPRTHLYVSLRCMNIDGSRYRLYAGGGLLKDSFEQQEWQETEAKLETMRSLIY